MLVKENAILANAFNVSEVTGKPLLWHKMRIENSQQYLMFKL